MKEKNTNPKRSRKWPGIIGAALLTILMTLPVDAFASTDYMGKVKGFFHPIWVVMKPVISNPWLPLFLGVGILIFFLLRSLVAGRHARRAGGGGGGAGAHGHSSYVREANDYPFVVALQYTALFAIFYFFLRYVCAESPLGWKAWVSWKNAGAIKTFFIILIIIFLFATWFKWGRLRGWTALAIFIVFCYLPFNGARNAGYDDAWPMRPELKEEIPYSPPGVPLQHPEIYPADGKDKKVP